MRPIPMALVLLALGSACAGSAHADRVAYKPVVTVEKSPYSIELVDGNGGLLDTYEHRGRFYVQGDAGERYTIRVSNPTDRRVEAVISVDGLDVVDGGTANFASKRGYIVPAYGSVDIDGFRTSTQQVAAFRFSSVSSSYAGRKGKARNVGVVGVAIFTERAQEVLVIPSPLDYRYRKAQPRGGASDKDYEVDASASADEGGKPSAKSAMRTRGLGSNDTLQREVPRERPGLGTAFGEQRESVVQFTSFVRANAKKPTAIAELRYNDSSGLRALGIRLRETISWPDQDELALRESASSFPDSQFAQPPR